MTTMELVIAIEKLTAVLNTLSAYRGDTQACAACAKIITTINGYLDRI